MHAGQQDAKADEHKEHPLERLLDAARAQPFEESRKPLDPQHHDVERDASRDLEHNRAGVEVGRRQDVPEVPVAPEVDQHRKAAERVAEHRRGQRRAYHRMKLAAVEDVDQERHGVAAAGKAGGDDDIPHDPDTPGVAVVDVGDGAEAVHEALVEEEERDADEQRQGDGQPANQPAANRFMPSADTWPDGDVCHVRPPHRRAVFSCRSRPPASGRRMLRRAPSGRYKALPACSLIEQRRSARAS